MRQTPLLWGLPFSEGDTNKSRVCSRVQEMSWGKEKAVGTFTINSAGQALLVFRFTSSQICLTPMLFVLQFQDLWGLSVT